ncbi:MAG TPA: L-histidine N(alpha)-methyltransferase [Bryobacteraceae bacterium]|jgi:dimethylhistidine N-methyltransferase|nr:L-histidine N(alpha)-methyltransferase [Bryobacteraceae bacterium]
MLAPALDNEFVRDVHAGLSGFGQKTLPCRYFYDAVGSALFEAITNLAEYGLTRADARILETHSRAIADSIPGPLVVAELGSGSGMKTRRVLESLGRQRAVGYFPIDVSATALAACAKEMEGLAPVDPIEDSYLAGMEQVCSRRRAGERMLVLFLGSTIGNFEREAAVDFLRALRSSLCPGDGLLLGTDLVKPTDRLLAAYDDAAGVTAAFNLNLLARINRELGGNFNLRHFHHQARYQPEAQRIEMHLRSREQQSVCIAKAGLTVEFAAGETILTEVCHKFRAAEIESVAHSAGFHLERQWLDEEWGFAESLLKA